MGVYASLWAQHLYRLLESVDSLWVAARVRLEAILSADEAMRDLGTSAPVALHLFSAGGRHLSVCMDILRLIEMLE